MREKNEDFLVSTTILLLILGAILYFDAHIDIKPFLDSHEIPQTTEEF